MGVASIRFARLMPSAASAVTCSGSASPAAAWASAGMSVSSTSVVLPEPDTPVTAISRPRGMSMANGFTVCKPLDSRWIRPRSNISPACACGRAATRAAPERKGPMIEASSRATSSTEPWETTAPPSAPAAGPISTRWSAACRMRVSWSTITTEFPSAIKSRITPRRPSMLAGCKPMEGSSIT